MIKNFIDVKLEFYPVNGKADVCKYLFQITDYDRFKDLCDCLWEYVKNSWHRRHDDSKALKLIKGLVFGPKGELICENIKGVEDVNSFLLRVQEQMLKTFLNSIDKKVWL